MSNNNVIRFIRYILSLAGVLHFINFLSGGLITIGQWMVPPSFSLAACFIIGFLVFKLSRISFE
tara:strand:+ start:183 stop:374 length:192 start_codon:yes stop_codon:yes gene_type:complete